VARGGAAGCGAACRAVWSLSAALPALSPAAAMGPASTALQGLMAAAEGRGPKAILLASCAALLLAQHPLAALAAPTAASTTTATAAAAAAAAAAPASGGEAAAVEAAAAGEVAPRLAAAVRALSAWLLLGGTEGSEGLCRMAGSALRAVGRSAALGGAFMSGSPNPSPSPSPSPNPNANPKPIPSPSPSPNPSPNPNPNSSQVARLCSSSFSSGYRPRSRRRLLSRPCSTFTQRSAPPSEPARRAARWTSTPARRRSRHCCATRSSGGPTFWRSAEQGGR
jgi:hypothetical protein